MIKYLPLHRRSLLLFDSAPSSDRLPSNGGIRCQIRAGSREAARVPHLSPCSTGTASDALWSPILFGVHFARSKVSDSCREKTCARVSLSLSIPQFLSWHFPAVCDYLSAAGLYCLFLFSSAFLQACSYTKVCGSPYCILLQRKYIGWSLLVTDSLEP